LRRLLIVSHWRARLPHNRIAGQDRVGNPAFKEDRRRSLKLAQIEPILATADVFFISLNPGIGEGERTAVAGRSNVSSRVSLPTLPIQRR
jgi:hypothetical protein